MNYNNRLWLNDTKPWQTVYLSPLSFGKYKVWEDEIYVLFTDNQTCSQIPQDIYPLACRCEEIRKKAGANIFSATTSDIHNYQLQPTRKYSILIDDSITQLLLNIPLYNRDKLHQWEYWQYRPVIFQTSQQKVDINPPQSILWWLLQKLFLCIKSARKQETTPPVINKAEQSIREQLKDLYSVMNCYQTQNHDVIEKEIEKVRRKEFQQQHYNPLWIADLIARNDCRDSNNYNAITEIADTMLQTYRKYKADTIDDIQILEKIKADATHHQDYEWAQYIATKITQHHQKS